MKLAGFKSFVDPTSVNFPSNLCGVVGPNGCGKSNIIDAVRWVMGESSAKQLRGESITDVIFNGSGGRKPVGQASIELIFDNSEGRITGEYAAFNEIAIRRRVSREGISDYFINGTKCRRRDVMDIFLGTGLGPRSYSIIEQGMISNMVTARPEDLRVYLEEAAGISKYKERRRDTENRIKRTRENLERLTDIREELERVLARLKRQSSAAEKYREYKQEERQFEQQVLALRWRELNQSAEQRREKARQAELEVEKQVTGGVTLDNQLEKLRMELGELNEAFNGVQQRFYSQGAEIARLEQQLESQKANARKRADELQRQQQNQSELAGHLEQDRNRRKAWQVEIEELGEQKQQAESAAASTRSELDQAEKSMQEWQAAWETVSREVADGRREADLKQASIQHAESDLKRSADRIDQLMANLISDEQAASMQQQLEKLQAERDQLDKTRSELSKSEAAMGQSVRDARESENQLREGLNQVRQERGAAESRCNSLREIYEAALESETSDVQQWLGQRGCNATSKLAEQLQVEAGWERAVELVLGDWLVSTPVESFADLIDQVDSFSGEGLALIDSAKSRVDSKPDSLASQVNHPAASALLTQVRCAADLSEALAMRSGLSEGESIITPQGVWLGSGWCRVGSARAGDSGILQRKAEIESLQKRIDELSTQEQQSTAKLDEAREVLARQEQQLNETRTQLGQVTAKLNQATSSWSSEKTRVEQLLQSRDAQAAEIEQLRERSQNLQVQVSQNREQLSTLIEAMDGQNRRRESLQGQREEIQRKLSEARQAERQASERVQQLAAQSQRVETQLAAVVEAITRLERQLSEVQSRREELEKQGSQGDNPIEELEKRLQEQLKLRLQVEEEMTASRSVLQAKESEMEALEKQRNELQQNLQHSRDSLNELRLETREVMTRCETLAEQLEGAKPQEILQQLPEDAEIGTWEEQLELVRRRIERLGPINLAAIDEYQEESERKTYLDAQNEELESALSTLENAIRKIDRETRTRFKETFDRVNAGFKTLFPQLFGGGHAYLELTDDDLLETGISIMARPPGKRNSTIQLLSGGEKALTAIALVFAIFQLNPAPFCMLDEVDAPLDDANVGRFADMVRKMSETVQFIFITHNKITMEMSGHLMGVTMHEPGVSRLVTVDVDKAVQLAEA